MENGNASKRHTVIYDGECGFCSAQIRRLSQLDWRKKFQFVPLADPRAGKIAPHLTKEELLDAIHCVANDGKTLRGARCIRFIGMRIPPLFPLALILWIPGMLWIAEKIYKQIARNRHCLSRACSS